MNKQKSPCILQDYVPFGTTALLPPNIMQSKAMGIADHILPLGDWFYNILYLKRTHLLDISISNNNYH